MKIVINRCFGGFSLSGKALEVYNRMTGYKDVNGWEIDRNDGSLVLVVEKFGEEANGRLSKLKVVEIPDGVDWEISNYDGMETIEEKHRSWC